MEGIMKKIISSILMATICAFCIFAGDVAEYHDLGFSKDGEFFVFAEYGVNDKTFDPYAKIYTVDVKKNEFVNMIIESKQYYEIDEQAEDYIAKTFKKYYSILMNNNNRN